MYFMVKDLKGSKRSLCGREQDDKTARWIWGQPIFRHGGFCCVMICKFEYIIHLVLVFDSIYMRYSN